MKDKELKLEEIEAVHTLGGPGKVCLSTLLSSNSCIKGRKENIFSTSVKGEKQQA